MESEEIMGRILYVMKTRAKRFREIKELTKFSDATITKYTHILEEMGLIKMKRDRDRRKQVYELNEERRDEIEKLIQAYLEYEKKEVKEKLELLLNMTQTEEKRKLIEVVLKELEK